VEPNNFIRATFVSNLINLDLFIVGELGMHGVNVTGPAAGRVMAGLPSVGLLHDNSRNSTPLFRQRYTWLRTTAYNGGYHYNGRIMYHHLTGHGRGMLELIKKTEYA
jgi:hypothetical protein